MDQPQTNNRIPFLLQPAGKDYLWGGTRLKEEFGKDLPLDPLAESWECSTHPDGLSYAASGAFKGQSLAQVLKDHPDFVGTHPRTKEKVPGAGIEENFPVLIKFIDANKDLSVQVHPTDAYARQYENGQNGKTELWYILDADEGARIIYGLSSPVSAQALCRGIADGSVGKYLQKVPVRKDDVFLVEAGTIHAIGAGVLLVEIQENSNLTYRLYDYDRVDKNGRKRPLHLDKALAVANLHGSPLPRQPLRTLRYKPGEASELIARCPYFEVHRRILRTEGTRSVSFRADDLSFHVLLCLEGSGQLRCEDEMLPITKGSCFFVPAGSAEILLQGQLQLLDVRG